MLLFANFMYTEDEQHFLGYRDRAKATETDLFNINLGYESDSTFCSCNGRYSALDNMLLGFPYNSYSDCVRHPNRYSDPMPHFDDFKTLDLD